MFGTYNLPVNLVWNFFYFDYKVDNTSMSGTMKSQREFKISKTIVSFIILWRELETNKPAIQCSVVHLDVENFSEELLQCLLCHKEPARRIQSPLLAAFCLLLAGSLWHKSSWFPCTERSYYRRPYAIKGFLRSKPPSRGLWMQRAGSLWHKRHHSNSSEKSSTSRWTTLPMRGSIIGALMP